MLLLLTHALLAAPCVPNPNPVCTKEFRPVCAAGVTYANPCLAAAACHADDSTPGVCGQSKSGGRALGGAADPTDYLLVGGVPIGSGPASNAAFGGHYTAAAPDNTGDHVCTGGRVWHECGLKCTRDCDSPDQMPCVLMCVPRCECPAAAPVWHGDECITADACPKPEKALLTRAGGFMAVDEAELAPGSKVDRLAAFGLSQLQSQVCAASNSLGCARLQGAHHEEVVGASTQVVSGLNYLITARTSAGLLTMRFYEQLWTGTLELSEASLSSPVGGASEALSVSSLLDQPLVLDAQAFDEIAPSSSTAAVPDEKAALDEALLTRVSGVMVGGSQAVDEAELAPGSKVDRLAAFGLSQLQSQVCAASNSLGCARLQGAHHEEVVGASTQVVSGLNYLITARTSAGLLTMRFYEQLWTGTLELSEASLSSPVGGASEALSVSSLLDQPLVLDAQAFDETALSSSTAAVPDEKTAFDAAQAIGSESALSTSTAAVPDEKAAAAPQTEAPPAHASLLLAPEQPLAAAPTPHPLQGSSRVSAEPQAAPAHPTLRTALHVGLGAAVGAGFLLLTVKVSGASKRETRQVGGVTAHGAAGRPSLV